MSLEWYQIVLPLIFGMISAAVGGYLGVKVGLVKLDGRVSYLEKMLIVEAKRVDRLEAKVFNLPHTDQ